MTRTLTATAALVFTVLVITLDTLTWPADSAPTSPATVCRIATHRAIAPDTDEEQPAGLTYSKQYGWGAEIDARLSKDGTPWAIHDAGIGRITGGADKRKVINMTDAQLRRVRLVHGGRPWTVAALMSRAATKRVRLLIELKPVPPGATVRWAHAPASVPTGLDRLAVATQGRVHWTTSRPDVWDNLTADDRFNTRLTAKPVSWDPADPTTLAGLTMAYLAPGEVTQQVVAVVKAAGVVPIRHVASWGATQKAVRAGVTTLVSHYPGKTRAACGAS